ncbi:DUF2155 domain-containing protein [Roseomonas sp. BN140053]|uniref:DUF2155 domain-containing protein n=1 Tax=Roseomonas sp. BN140053 TaxID=3391898 RepID=UPI0039ED0778
MTRALPVALLLGGLGLALLPQAALAQEWVPAQHAQLQALDKVTARVTVLQADVGRPVQFGTLNITVRACNARPPDEVPDAAAYLEIKDGLAGPNASPVFRGWMLANTPAANMLQHPVYDLRILECR